MLNYNKVKWNCSVLRRTSKKRFFQNVNIEGYTTHSKWVKLTTTNYTQNNEIADYSTIIPLHLFSSTVNNSNKAENMNCLFGTVFGKVIIKITGIYYWSNVRWVGERQENNHLIWVWNLTFTYISYVIVPTLLKPQVTSIQ